MGSFASLFAYHILLSNKDTSNFEYDFSKIPETFSFVVTTDRIVKFYTPKELESTRNKDDFQGTMDNKQAPYKQLIIST